MRKLSEYKDDEAWEIIADLLDPLTDMALNSKFRAILDDPDANRLEKVQVAIKECKPQLTHILAVLHGEPVETYHVSIGSIMRDITEILNDRDLLDFFASQSQTNSDTMFGSVTENIAE